MLATDPDADRLGVYAKDSKTGEYMAFTGNMSGMIICEYELSQRKAKGLLPENGAIVTTIVSGNMAQAAAEEYGAALIETLTGFKYIGEQIKFFEQGKKDHTFLFGFEESYGCLVGTHARDKDAVVAVMALCEAAAYYRSCNLTLWDQMQALFEKYGYYKEGLYTLTLKGAEGAQRIQHILKSFRSDPPKRIGAWRVEAIRDYSEDKLVDYRTGEEKTTGLPKSNVLYFELEENAWCCVRPSGTEPKVKFYMGVKGSSLQDTDQKLEALTQALTALIP